MIDDEEAGLHGLNLATWSKRNHPWYQAVDAMQTTMQNNSQSILDHGKSVWNHVKALYGYPTDLITEWRLPEWFDLDKLRPYLKPDWMVEAYAFWHDIGKPYCVEDGHFVNHAAVSEMIFNQIGGNPEIGRLIGMDMDIHTLKADGVKEFAHRPEAITLLIVGLAEIHANAAMFGGIDSLSFKIKYRQIEKRGKQILTELGIL